MADYFFNRYILYAVGSEIFQYCFSHLHVNGKVHDARISYDPVKRAFNHADIVINADSDCLDYFVRHIYFFDFRFFTYNGDAGFQVRWLNIYRETVNKAGT